MKCGICGREFSCNRNLSIHIVKTHHVTLKEYYDKYLKKENDGLCINCNNPTNFINIVGYRKYCSVKCMSNSDEISEKRKQTNIKNNGVCFPMQSKLIQEKSHYISDFSGQPFENDIISSTLYINFDYGSEFDGEELTLHLSDLESKEVLDFLYSKVKDKSIFRNIGYEN